MTWRITFNPRAEAALDRLPDPTRRRIRAAIVRLARDPYSSPNVKALRGGGYRLRVGDWRVIYTLQDDVLVVLVLRVAHRREAYTPR